MPAHPRLFERRRLKDRRTHPTPILSRHTVWGGMREIVRREADKSTILFVDRFRATLIAAVMVLFLLNVFDAYLTLVLSHTGVEEGNPFLRYLLSLGTTPFLLVKFSFTAIALCILSLLQNVVLVRCAILPLLLLVYFTIILYELYMLAMNLTR